MIPQIESVLYIDPQSRTVSCFCEKCGGECYHPSRLCTDCEAEP